MNARTTTVFVLAAMATAGMSILSSCKATYRPPTGGEVTITFDPHDRAAIYAALEKLKAENEQALVDANAVTPPNTGMIKLANANIRDIKAAKERNGYTPPAGSGTG